MLFIREISFSLEAFYLKHVLLAECQALATWQHTQFICMISDKALAFKLVKFESQSDPDKQGSGSCQKMYLSLLT